MKAVTYARFSTDKQSDNSIEDQVRNCQRYAEREDMTIIRQYEDKAISGASNDRPGYINMREAAKNGEFEALLVDDLSRLSRDDVEMKQVIRLFKFWGIKIVGVSDGYDSTAKGEKIQSTMRGLMNEIYLDDLREKTHRGLSGKAMKGYSAGGRTYGYKRKPVFSTTRMDANGRPDIEHVEREINEEEARWVRQIFKWFAHGKSPKGIANELNRMGVPSARNSTWCASAIYGDMTDGTGLLNNELYIGRYIWNRSEWVKNPDTGKRKRIKRPKKEWIIKPMPELRIIPQELWEAVKARQEGIKIKSKKLREALNNPKTRSRTGKYLFSGLLKCGCCGANYTMHSLTSYGCSFNISRGDSVCDNKLRVPRKLLEEILLHTVQEELLSDEAIQLFIEETTKLLSENKKKPHSEYTAHKHTMRAAKKEIDNLMKAIKAGVVTPTTKSELQRAEADYEKAKTAIEATKSTREALTATLPEAAKRYRKLVGNLGNALQSDISHARRCLETLLGSIRLIPNRTGGYLEAELSHNPEGLLKLAINREEFKVQMVAGVGFEPTTFRL